MIKRVFICLFTALLISGIFLGNFEVQAAEGLPYAYDEAGNLTAEQLADVEQRLKVLSDKYDFDVIVYFENDLRSYDAESSADDTFDYEGYGRGTNRDGIIFYMAMNSRDYWFSTRGYGIKAFNDYAIDTLKETIQPMLSNGDYYEATLKYIELVDEIVGITKSGKEYRDEGTVTLVRLGAIGAAVIIPFIIAGVATASKTAQMNTSRTNDYAANYVEENSMRLHKDRDIFLYSNVVRKAKPKESSSSSSGSHTSSSGASHGGGGGKF